MTPEEYLMLYEIVAGLHDDSYVEGFVVEFGSCEGVSASIIASAIQDHRPNDFYSKLIAVDPYPSFSNFSFIRAFDLYRKMELTEYIHPIIARSFSFLPLWNHPTRVFLIDSSHTYDETKLEIEGVLPLLLKGGWMLFHDYLYFPEGVPPEKDSNRVHLALHEFLDSQTDYKIDVYYEHTLIALHFEDKRLG